MQPARGLRVALALLAACGAAVAGEIVIYEHADYRGRSLTIRQAASDLEAMGMNDRVSSLVVRSGTWRLCTDAGFRGQCHDFAPGEYRNLDESLNDRFSSLGEVAQATVLRGEQQRLGAYASAGAATLYEDEGFQGSAVEVRASSPNLELAGFNDRARSLVVHQGYWTLCEHADYRGDCRSFGPGRYESLDGKIGGRVSSMRLAGGTDPAAREPAPRWGGGGSRAVLYEQGNFGGRSLVIDAEVVADFARAGFNDRAASMRIEGGYWIFCSDAGFQGECRTFGPGDHAALEGAMARRISSGRRIHPRYPYASAPAWR